MRDRIFTVKMGDEEVTLRLKKAPQGVLAKADLIQRASFSEAFRQGALTRAEALSLLRKRGAWTDEDDVTERDMRLAIIELEKKLENLSLTDEEGEAICVDIEKARLELLTFSERYQGVLSNTCENIAREERNKYICSECTVYNADSKRVYKNVEDFNSRMNEGYSVDAFKETIIALLEVVSEKEFSSNLEDEYAENKWRSSRAKAE